MPLMPRSYYFFKPEFGSPALEQMMQYIPEGLCITILKKLSGITTEELESLKNAMLNPAKLLGVDSIIHRASFPYIALNALGKNNISALEFGSLMELWGSLNDICPTGDAFPEPKFIPLFDHEGKRNSQALELLLQSLQPTILPHFVKKTPETLLEELYQTANNLSPSEQGFWLVQDRTDKVRFPDFPSVILAGDEYRNSRTITQRLKSALRTVYLTLPLGSPQEMIPSFGLRQTFLNIAFPHPVKINPVIGESTVKDVRLGGLKRCRDIGLPYPQINFPKMADGYPAPSVRDFTIHDWAHCLQASLVNPEETIVYVRMGDRLKLMQKHLNQAIHEYEIRHKEHQDALPKLKRVLKKLTPEAQTKAIEKFANLFHKEEQVIKVSRNLHKALGQLKFRFYDMDRAFNGSELYSSDEKYPQLARIIENAGAEVVLHNDAKDAALIGFTVSRIIARALFDAMQLNAEDLNIFRTAYERQVQRMSTQPPVETSPPTQRTYKLTVEFYKGISMGSTALPSNEMLEYPQP